jgi:hypothetical protein
MLETGEDEVVVAVVDIVKEQATQENHVLRMLLSKLVLQTYLLAVVVEELVKVGGKICSFPQEYYA